MKILLDYKIDIEVRESNKTKEKLTIFYREFSKSEKKEHEKLKDEFKKLYKQAQKLSRKQSSLDKKAELHELNENYSKSLEIISEKEKVEVELEKISQKLEDLGNGDTDTFAEKSSKEKFEVLVSGTGKEKLAELAEIKSYVEIMKSLDIAKVELEKKPSGE